MIDLESGFKGICAMKLRHGKVKYSIRKNESGRAWFDMWTPSFHRGRGPYVSIGLWVVTIYRGY